MTPRLHFHIPLPQGLAWLDLPCAEPDAGLPQARALAAALPALAALESWLLVDLPCPDPVPASGGAPGGAQLVLPFEPGSALAGGQMVLPWSVLRPGRQAPAAFPVLWPQLPARVCVQVLPLPRVPASGLVPGAVLLLPSAFLGSWPVQVHAGGPARGTPPDGWQAVATWQPREARLSLGGGPVQAAPDPAMADAWSVWLTAPLSVDLRAWFGGCGSNPVVPAGQAELRRGGETVAQGSLLPCGAGWGLRIERVDGLQRRESPESLMFNCNI